MISKLREENQRKDRLIDAMSKDRVQTQDSDKNIENLIDVFKTVLYAQVRKPLPKLKERQQHNVLKPLLDLLSAFSDKFKIPLPNLLGCLIMKSCYQNNRHLYSFGKKLSKGQDPQSPVPKMSLDQATWIQNLANALGKSNYRYILVNIWGIGVKDIFLIFDVHPAFISKHSTSKHHRVLQFCTSDIKYLYLSFFCTSLLTICVGNICVSSWLRVPVTQRHEHGGHHRGHVLHVLQRRHGLPVLAAPHRHRAVRVVAASHRVALVLRGDK